MHNTAFQSTPSIAAPRASASPPDLLDGHFVAANGSASERADSPGPFGLVHPPDSRRSARYLSEIQSPAVVRSCHISTVAPGIALPVDLCCTTTTCHSGWVWSDPPLPCADADAGYTADFTLMEARMSRPRRRRARRRRARRRHTHKLRLIMSFV
ncbi:hypothetical protein VTJ04DRAFT_8917 [Mycothermus thermophilus]|uniref:uncharacterized protein n=1 Tax=Humicola insolens TaxID=85995 RepID=UPI0037447963